MFGSTSRSESFAHIAFDVEWPLLLVFTGDNMIFEMKSLRRQSNREG